MYLRKMKMRIIFHTKFMYFFFFYEYGFSTCFLYFIIIRAYTCNKNLKIDFLIVLVNTEFPCQLDPVTGQVRLTYQVRKSQNLSIKISQLPSLNKAKHEQANHFTPSKRLSTPTSRKQDAISHAWTVGHLDSCGLQKRCESQF